MRRWRCARSLIPAPYSMGASSGRSLNQTSQNPPGPVSVSACELAGERGAELADHAVDGGGGDTQVLAGHGNGHQGTVTICTEEVERAAGSARKLSRSNKYLFVSGPLPIALIVV
ncbi:hypothetical protein FIV06_29935 (plasmid) [Labrenzia sp. THAF191b]|nr:hypothetical protein FIV06_29935 [Labrenzia sp. THAF191b]QFT07895.1 hypothetical protein FIV05_29385 [Labrenzia sp. THAF191a]QFT19239.1 hypothetical protein FIV03_28400 [Labrenzia sp. THAF187b]